MLLTDIVYFQTTIRRTQPLHSGHRERQLENMRRKEDFREDTIRRLNQEKMLEANMNNENRVLEKRYIRTVMMDQKEQEMEEAILKV